MPANINIPDLSFIAAPMVNQSDLPFRTLVRKYGATLVYTQMLLPSRVLADRDYLEFHQRCLGMDVDRPVVVQLAGNDSDALLQASRKFVGLCEGIGGHMRCRTKSLVHDI
jgi:tRNA-dihydrouridine synthase 1